MRMILLAAILAGSALPAHAQLESVPQRTRDWAQKQVENFVDVWSRDEEVNMASVERLYAPRAVYYGKSMSRAAILADKRAYVARWPQRRYDIVPGSVKISCTKGNAMCRADALMRWTRSDRAGRTVRGSSRMTFLVSRDSGGKIVRESAVNLR